MCRKNNITYIKIIFTYIKIIVSFGLHPSRPIKKKVKYYLNGMAQPQSADISSVA